MGSERLTWEQIIEKYPEHTVGLKNVIKNDKGGIESAEVAYAFVMLDIPSGVELPEVEMNVLTDPCPLGMLMEG